jgi:hypothetical protein
VRVGYPFVRALCIAAGIIILAVPAARAAYVININEVGPDVIGTGSGSIDIKDLTYVTSAELNGSIAPSLARVLIGNTAFVNAYVSISGPSSFGSEFGLGAETSEDSGPIVGITSGNELFVEEGNYAGYISAESLGTSTATWSNSSFSSLGLTPGSYVYTWGTGPDADSFTVNIGPTPEPTSLSLFALTSLALLRRRQRASA